MRLEFRPATSVTLDGRSPFFIWDVSRDAPQKLYQGTTASRLETDRLIKRLEKLRDDKADEEAKIRAIDDEITTIQQRLDELAQGRFLCCGTEEAFYIIKLSQTNLGH